MIKKICSTLALASFTLVSAAQTTQLAGPEQRITDATIRADQQSIEALQARIEGLNNRGRAVRDYHLAKAQCWLDVGFHEYTRNDRSGFAQAALSESEKLIVAMERDENPMPMDTALANDASRLRPDLWARAAAMRGQAGWTCAQQQSACAEVELAHAGVEYDQLGWRHAQPYVQIAEDLLADANAMARACPPAQR